MSVKISLNARKRTKDLGDHSTFNAKKQELLALKNAPRTKTHSQNKQTEVFAHELFTYYQQLCAQGDARRYTYSPREREAMLIEKIRHAMYQHAFKNQKSGMKRSENQTDCQTFTDEIAQALKTLGLTLNKLTVNDTQTTSES